MNEQALKDSATFRRYPPGMREVELEVVLRGPTAQAIVDAAEKRQMPVYEYLALAADQLEHPNRSLVAYVHELKSHPEFFEAIRSGRKTFDLRRFDRPFSVGDTLILREYVPTVPCYTGRAVKVEVTYITSVDHPCPLSSEGLAPGFCILGIRLKP